MNRMLSACRKFYIIFSLLLVFFMLGQSLAFAASASGSAVVAEGSATFNDGFAFRITDTVFDIIQKETIVILSQETINKEELTEQLRGKKADQFMSVLWDKLKGAFAVLTIYKTSYDEEKINLHLHFPGNISLNYSIPAEIKINNTDQHTAGSYIVNSKEMDDSPRKINLQWDLDITNLDKP